MLQLCPCSPAQVLQFKNISFKLLLHPQCFSFALALQLKCSLHSINCLHEVLAGAFKLFFILNASALPLLSSSSAPCIPSIAFMKFLRVLSNSSSSSMLQLCPCSPAQVLPAFHQLPS